MTIFHIFDDKLHHIFKSHTLKCFDLKSLKLFPFWMPWFWLYLFIFLLIQLWTCVHIFTCPIHIRRENTEYRPSYYNNNNIVTDFIFTISPRIFISFLPIKCLYLFTLSLFLSLSYFFKPLWAKENRFNKKIQPLSFLVDFKRGKVGT